MATRLTPGFAFCFILTLGIGVSACTTQKLASFNSSAVGEYTLLSVDGRSVPADISHDGVAMKVLSGRFTIAADGTCRSRTVFVPPSGAEVTREVTATYTGDGSRLTMRWEGAGTTVGTIQSGTLTMNNEGMEFVYRRSRSNG